MQYYKVIVLKKILTNSENAEPGSLKSYYVLELSKSYFKSKFLNFFFEVFYENVFYTKEKDSEPVISYYKNLYAGSETEGQKFDTNLYKDVDMIRIAKEILAFFIKESKIETAKYKTEIVFEKTIKE